MQDGFIRDELLDGFENDEPSGDKNERCLEYAGNVFDLLVTIWVSRVCGTLSDPDGKEGHDSRRQVYEGMNCLGNCADGAGWETYREFDRQEDDIGEDRQARRARGSIHRGLLVALTLP